MINQSALLSKINNLMGLTRQITIASYTGDDDSFEQFNFTASKVGLEIKQDLEEMQKEIDELRERAYWLSCLESAGVDNWEGYSYAQEIKNGRW